MTRMKGRSCYDSMKILLTGIVLTLVGSVHPSHIHCAVPLAARASQLRAPDFGGHHATHLTDRYTTRRSLGHAGRIQELAIHAELYRGGCPPSDSSMSEDHGKEWTTAEKATWMVMNASTSGLIQLLPIHGSEAVLEVASAVRNVCNATLSLLFTAALFIWGLLVNRKQAWRTDGGTAAFGAAALLLAVASTALTFLYVPREEEYVWLPGLMWAIILWQSFLGWWWWVGAGSAGAMNGWDGMEEEMIRREKREKRRKAKLERRKRAGETRLARHGRCFRQKYRIWRGKSRTT
ncbi:NADH pyrophosphatase [Salix suchowensis]|nr:NADH pyrophosphatase [Salix suchowensis]